MRIRISFKSWGNSSYIEPRWLLMAHDYEYTMATCIAEGIARANDLQLIAFARQNETDAGHPQYHITLGRPTERRANRGMEDVVSIGFSFDPDQGSTEWRRLRAYHEQRMLALLGLDDPPRMAQ